MTLAIFDLDNTLIKGDSDHAWSEFLIQQGLVDPTTVAEANDRFYQQYLHGGLNIHEYLEFALSFLAGKTVDEMATLHRTFMHESIEPMMLPKAFDLIQKHKEQGDTLLIITATNRFVTEPIALHLGIENLIACEPEIVDGRYTGKSIGIPSFQHGKVERLQAWLQQRQESLDGAWFYSDSHNDLPLLEQVDHPVAVNPDETLQSIATERDWPILDLRNGT